ncbi:penicillin-binding protein [Actinopolymorpha sp. B9G3]|uniref:penicillin-binding protein n=1 Tax=Actinopolymorpha sp. B9G3 TaxID=3158970 RepID=UPI0032D99994
MSSIRVKSRTSRERGFVSHLLMFVVISVLTGALVAGLVIPFAGVLGLTTQSATDAFENMDATLENPPLPERSRVLAADGSQIATFYERNRVQVTLDKIAPVMQRAILAIEDARFYQHGPLDAQGTLRAFVRNSQGGQVSQGGSTVTQQYVKLVQYENAKTPEEQRAVIEDSYGRKLQELRYAVELEKTMTKDEILERYFNIVYFGDGAYGIESAAKHYFNTSAAKLTLPQAAMLAGLVRDPNGLDAKDNPEAVLGRRNLVLSRMVHEGMVSAKEGAEAAGTDLGLRMTQSSQGCYYSRYPFFCDYARQVLLRDPALGKTREDRERLLDRGGLTIQTTLDQKAQRAADKAVAEAVRPTDKVIGALSMVEPGTGRVKAIAQSRKYGEGKGKTYVNLNVPRKYNGTLGYQPGSTYKPFVMAAAIRQGIPLSTSLPSPTRMRHSGSMRNCPGGQPGWISTPWDVSNSTSAGSTSNLISGTARSVNTFYANLEAQTGICEPANIATRLGAVRANGDPLDQVKPFVLGVNEVAPISMAEAYATFAARGLHCPATPVLKVLDRQGNPIKLTKTECKQVIPQAVADGVNYVLREVVDGDDPGRTGQRMSMANEGRQVAGKTGTSNSRIAVWFLGYTTNLATAAVVTDAEAPQQSLMGQRIGGRTVTGDQVWGGTLAGPMWLAAMRGALEGRKSPNFVNPSPKMLVGIPTTVPSVLGMDQDRARSVLRKANFSMAVGGSTNSDLPRGTIVRQTPGPNTSAGSGSTVIVYLSNGIKPKPTPTPKPKPIPTTPGPFPKPTLPPPPDDDSRPG